MSRQEHILVWRLSAMGDVAMTVPVLTQFQKQYPNVRLTVVSKPFLEPIFKTLPNISFIAADVHNEHKGVLGLYRLFKELRKQNVTHVADLHNVLRSQIIRTFFKSSGIPIATIDKGRVEKKELTKSQKKKIKQLKTTHQRYADVFTKLGYPLELQPVERLKFPLTKNITKLIGKKTSPWIGVAPFAAFESKMYPLDLLKEVLENMSKYNSKILLLGGGKEEVEQLEQLEDQISGSINIAGRFAFTDELSLISNLDIMISMDSGNGHLAAMYGVDVITLWGVTHPYAGFTPFMQPLENQILPDLDQYPLIPCSIYGNKVFKGYEQVMETIRPEKIIKRVRNLLQKKEP